MNEIEYWVVRAVDYLLSLIAWAGNGRHRKDKRADTPVAYVPRHLVKKTETPYSTPGRATDRGSWGDEPTQPWSIIPPREQWGW